MAKGGHDDPYEVLGVPPDADDSELRAAWRRLALRWHPDHAGPETTAIFQRILAAYSLVADPGARAEYDRRRGVVRRTPEPAPASPPLRRAPGVMIQRLSGPLEALLARGVARRAADGVIELVLEPAEVAEGGMVTIAMHVEVRDAGGQVVEDRFSAWLAVRPGVSDGTLLRPSAQLPGVIEPVMFRVRLG